VEESMLWMAVDERGGFTSSSGCHVNSKEPDASPIDCWTWIRDLETGTGVAYADVGGGGVAMDDHISSFGICPLFETHWRTDATHPR